MAGTAPGVPARQFCSGCLPRQSLWRCVPGGVPEWLASPQTELRNRHIVVVDDFDAGVTLPFVAARCREAGASQVTTVALVRKCHARPQAGLLPDRA